MFFVIKRRSVLLAAGIVAAFLAVLIAFASRENLPVFAVPAANRVIVVDAGHGGIDAGASANGVIEKEINLKIALKLRDYLEQSGGVVILTRDEDDSTDAPNRTAGSSY